MPRVSPFSPFFFFNNPLSLNPFFFIHSSACDLMAERIILSLFQNSFNRWKGKFFKVRATKFDPTALEGFPLYWSERPISTKALALDDLAPADREVCKALAGLGVVFDTAKLIVNEFNAHGLSTYFGTCF